MEAILKALGPILAPMLIEVWKASLKPAIATEIAKLGSPDLQVVANAFLVALDTIVVTEAPKL